MLTGKFVGMTSSASALAYGGRLELRAIGGERAHFLDGERVSIGDEIEVLLSGDRWLRGRYDWSRIEARWAGLRVPLGGPWEGGPPETFKPAAVLALHPDAIVRWPPRR